MGRRRALLRGRRRLTRWIRDRRGLGFLGLSLLACVVERENWLALTEERLRLQDF
jgi:hypothetical protein